MLFSPTHTPTSASAKAGSPGLQEVLPGTCIRILSILLLSSWCRPFSPLISNFPMETGEPRSLFIGSGVKQG